MNDATFDKWICTDNSLEASAWTYCKNTYL